MDHLASEPATAPIGHPAVGVAAPLDLQPFCGTEESRPYLMKPFSREGFTYATDGHILVRASLRTDVPDMDQKLNLAKQFEGFDQATFFVPTFNLPAAPAEAGECTACAGRGYQHECPDCECICQKCDGRGDLDIERITSTAIGPKLYALNYVRMIAALPDVELAEMAAEPLMTPLWFRFTGGIGALMPMRDKHVNHVEIEAAAPLNNNLTGAAADSAGNCPKP